MEADSAAKPAPGRLDRVQQIRPVDGWSEPRLQGRANLPGREGVDDQDRTRYSAGAQLDTLLEQRDAQGIRSGALEGPCDRWGSMPVGVRFDDRENPPPTDARPDSGEVGDDAVEVDDGARRPRGGGGLAPGGRHSERNSGLAKSV